MQLKGTHSIFWYVEKITLRLWTLEEKSKAKIRIKHIDAAACAFSSFHIIIVICCCCYCYCNGTIHTDTKRSRVEVGYCSIRCVQYTCIKHLRTRLSALWWDKMKRHTAWQCNVYEHCILHNEQRHQYIILRYLQTHTLCNLDTSLSFCNPSGTKSSSRNSGDHNILHYIQNDSVNGEIVFYSEISNHITSHRIHSI